MKLTLAAVMAAAAVAVGLPASASAQPPVDAPPGSTCTFAKGITTCVETLSVLIGRGVGVIDDPDCPSGRAQLVTETTTIERRITVFRGTHQQGDPRTETETSTTETTTCLAPD